ncbi:MAG: phosphate uptake regulator PhoU [Candidatus Delongbacteria bacterium]|nr:phosphate uptake regulator PhoU [Candidatus Delongbacteria bacterium]
MFKQFFNLIKKQDLLTQALHDSYEMSSISQQMFNLVTDMIFNDLSEKVNESQVEEVKKKDYLLNHFERSIRKKVFEHVIVNEKPDQELYTSFILITIVQHLERIGDYCKNINEIAEIKFALKSDEYNILLQKYTEILKKMFSDTYKSFKNADVTLASTILNTQFKFKNEIDDKLYEIATKDPDPKINYVTYALMLRYYKRISAHLMNISTSITNPIDKIGYYVSENMIKDDE